MRPRANKRLSPNAMKNAKRAGQQLWNRRRLQVESLESRQLLAVDAQLIADLNLEPGGSDTSSITTNSAQLGNVLVFTAETPTTGVSLWRTDGTTAGTELLKDIFPGANGANPYQFLKVGNVAYFNATDSDHGAKLWRSDGTVAGTYVVKDINTGSAGSAPLGMTNVNGTIYFSARIPNRNYSLWKSDGTESGTVMVQEYAPSSFNNRPTNFTNVNNTLYFTKDLSFSTSALWKSDGTAVGTTLVKSGPGKMTYLTEMNGGL
jgi:ELWxxDGT repeat protein